MAQSEILLDTNSYFRLAKSIHPLLDTIFGDKKYCLYVLAELDYEFKKNKRLKTQFSWVEDEEFQSNRETSLALSKQNKKNIALTIGFLKQHKIDNSLGASRIDILYLAHGHVLSVPVVTDDGDMIQVAKDFNIKTMKTLELMRLMVDCGHIDIHKVKQIVAYWEYIGDIPGNFRTDYKKSLSDYRCSD